MSPPVLTSAPLLPRRPRESHKGDYGRVHILAGRVGYTGAPVLAASGAVRGGAGLVSLGVPQGIWAVTAAKLLSAMPSPLPGGERLTPAALEPALGQCREKDAVLLGPGLGSAPDTAQLVRALVPRIPCPLVLDADGINALAGHIDILDERRGRLTVLTPHPGEFARLTGRSPGEDRAQSALAFARAHGCVVILKGHRTVTAYPDGRAFLNPTGNPGMAKGGSGDVLAGLVLAFLAQGLAAEDAVYLHGLAGDLAAQALGEYAMAPGDLLDCLPRAMAGCEEK